MGYVESIFDFLRYVGTLALNIYEKFLVYSIFICLRGIEVRDVLCGRWFVPSLRAIIGECDGCGMFTAIFLAKRLWIINDIWAGDINNINIPFLIKYWNVCKECTKI